ncbi:putative membrane component involved in biofilm formation [Bacillus freudenreichii]|nr:putative membrane component involved in biofilm formation [Bacillus freudenreichii]
MIKEWNLLRALACLCILFLHSTTQMSKVIDHPEVELYHYVRILLCMATPAFIVLSIVILANRYPNRLPDNFWVKRVNYILIPFLFFAVIDALVTKYFNSNIMIDEKITENILTGNFVGWFILVIFQFYVLHYLVTKWKLSMKWMLPLSLILMFSYLFMMNEGLIKLDSYSHVLRLPFLAWFGYFTVAYVIGKYYNSLSKTLLKYRWLTLMFLALSATIVYFSYDSGLITGTHSRRMDLFPLVISFCLAVFAWGQKMPGSKVVNLISNYSFGIYLLHWQFQRLLAPHVAGMFSNYLASLILLFVVSLAASIVTIKLISYLPFGSFIVGKVRKGKKEPVRAELVEKTA